MFDKEQWDAMVVFMADAMVRLEKALKDPLMHLNLN